MKKTKILLSIFLYLTITIIVFNNNEILAKDLLTIGFVPSENVMKVIKQYSKFIEYLSKAINYKIEPRFFDSYKQLTKALDLYQIDIAMIAPFEYINISNKKDYQVIARTIRNNKDTYRGEIITLKNSKIKELKDLKGETIGLVDEQSCSGYLYPLLLLAENKIYPADLKIKILNTHDNVLYATLYGEVSAGAVFEGAEKKYLDKKLRGKINVIAYTEEIITDPVILRTALDETIKKNLKNAILNAPDNSLPDSINKFKGATDKDYDEIRFELKRFNKIMSK